MRARGAVLAFGLVIEGSQVRGNYTTNCLYVGQSVCEGWSSASRVRWLRRSYFRGVRDKRGKRGKSRLALPGNLSFSLEPVVKIVSVLPAAALVNLVGTLPDGLVCKRLGGLMINGGKFVGHFGSRASHSSCCRIRGVSIGASAAACSLSSS